MIDTLHPTALDTLPVFVLREVFSWSADSATINAFLGAFQASHALRQDPSTAALLLLRLPTNCDHFAALTSCAPHKGGTTAVVQQLLQLLRAGPDSGGPHTAPPSLLQAMLYVLSRSDRTITLQALLTLPHPPDVNADQGRALLSALIQGSTAPHMGAVQALLAAGADTCAPPRLAAFDRSAESPVRLPALQLLLQHCSLHCPPETVSAAYTLALSSAIACSNVPTLALLLTAHADATGSAPAILGDHLDLAACYGNVAVLQLLLSHLSLRPSPGALARALHYAVDGGHLEFATVLLDRGADANVGYDGAVSKVLLRSLGLVKRGRDRPAMVRLLLGRGAQVTPEVAKEARWTRDDELVSLLCV